MGGCECKHSNSRILPVQRRIRPTRIFLTNVTPPAPRARIETLSPRSDISCNFTYDSDEDVDLITALTAALSILVMSIQDEYDICVICTDRIATMKTTICNHKLLCTRCYIGYCLKKLDPICPLCRRNMNINDPFTLS